MKVRYKNTIIDTNNVQCANAPSNDIVEILFTSGHRITIECKGDAQSVLHLIDYKPSDSTEMINIKGLTLRQILKQIAYSRFYLHKKTIAKAAASLGIDPRTLIRHTDNELSE